MGFMSSFIWCTICMCTIVPTYNFKFKRPITSNNNMRGSSMKSLIQYYGNHNVFKLNYLSCFRVGHSQ